MWIFIGHNISSDSSGNILNHYRGQDCMEKFCDYIEEHVNMIMKYKRAGTINLTEDERKRYEEQFCSVCNDLFSKNNK